MKRYLRIFILLGLISSLSFMTLLADDGLAQHYTGHIDDNTPDFTIDVEVLAGQLLIIEANSLSNDLDTYLILKDSRGNTLAENDDKNLYDYDSYLGFYAVEDGSYEVVLSNILGTSGRYGLTITIGDEALMYEETTETDWLDGEYDSVYEFEFEAGETTIIQTEILAGNLDPYISLLDSDGNILALNDDLYTGNFNGYLTYTFSETDTYEIVVSAWDETSGDYQLYIQVFDDIFDGDYQTVSTPSSEEEYTVYDEKIVTGTLDHGGEMAIYEFEVVAGQGVIVTAESVTKGLDLRINVMDAEENTIADDRSESWNFGISYFVAAETDTYLVSIVAENDTSGDYQINIQYVDPEYVLTKTRVELSGPAERIETEHFVIHYTQEGEDAITPERAYFIADIMENVYDVQINQMGWYAPVTDGMQGGDSRYDVYIQDLLTTDGVYGYAIPEYPIQDNPHSPYVDEYAMGGYLIVAGKYDDTPEEVERLLISTLAHEFHHLIQFGYNGTGDNWWYYESTSTYFEVATIPPYNDALTYVESVLYYPEVCFGAMNEADPDGFVQYGSWLFIQSLVDAYGTDIVKEFWQNVAIHDHGWHALEITLEPYGATVTDVLSRYHAQNLVRDYKLAPLFEGQDRVWLEGIIDDTGLWQLERDGVQELGASYYVVNLEGSYEFHLVDAPEYLKLYGVGINKSTGTADIFDLGTIGAVDTSVYDIFNLFVFNGDYHDELGSCNYATYSIGIKATTNPSQPVAYSMDAARYLPLDEEYN